ncbi:hypothetical protein BV210_17925 (plasmid) [Halorientalis sp. IM1011]|uniref:hypothetical protein n=1 Tax=Halorientalis sp. IM1011 TaxID=1932360 RepID=UPI00097CC302|nr:hypothetical protein [Halorientalis sp. IM1011]AQL44644.1 hypothetical protein BV210_17925 [Halorientalis sp. IM1011]
MTRSKSDESTTSTTADWPTFGLSYTYNPTTELSVSLDLRPDELLVTEAGEEGVEDRWLSAERGSYVPIEDVR